MPSGSMEACGGAPTGRPALTVVDRPEISEHCSVYREGCVWGARMPSARQGELLDRIYAAGVEPALWPSVVQNLGDALGASAGLLMIPASFGVSPFSFASYGVEIKPEAARYYASVQGRATLTNRAMALGRAPAVFTLDELVPPERRHLDDFWRRGLEPQGWTDGLAAILRLPAEEDGPPVILNYFKDRALGPMAGTPTRLFQSLFPHLRRAVGLTLASRNAKIAPPSTSAVIEALDDPCVLIDDWSVILASNESFERLLTSRPELTVHDGRLQFETSADQAWLFAWLESARAGLLEAGDFTLGMDSDEGPIFVSLTPVGGSKPGDPRTGHLVRLLNATEGPAADAYRRLRDFFGLTQAESTIALALGRGLSVADIADERGSSQATVRLQIKSALQKMQLHRQSALSALVARLVL